MTTIDTKIQAQAATLVAYAHAAAAEIAHVEGTDPATVLGLLASTMAKMLQPKKIVEEDARAASWRCRFRIYERDNDEPLADSDPDLTPEKPGAEVIQGLPAVGDALLQMAVAFHERPDLRGMNTPEVDRRIRAFRPTLSRRGGNGTLRVPYDTPESWRDTPDHRGAFVMRVDIERVIP